MHIYFDYLAKSAKKFKILRTSRFGTTNLYNYV